MNDHRDEAETFAGAIDRGIVWAFTHSEHRCGVPSFTPEWVRRRFGDSLGAAVLSAISRLQQQATAIGDTIDWSTTSLAEAQKFVEQRLIETNKGVSRPAANWIARWYTFTVK
ncbi:hypothetical protein ACXVUM_13330 [Williamsia sp. SKLECPSW1]